MKQKLFLIGFSLLSAFSAQTQTPYFYNSDGTHGVINDPNWNTTTLKLNEEFTNETTTKNNWKYNWLAGHAEKSDCFYLTGDVCYDNYQSCTPYNFSTNHNHTYNTSGTGTMTLSSRFENPIISTYYTVNTATTSYTVAKTYSLSTGLAISKMAYRYGFFEARFKVNRPAGSQCKGLGQCFWLFSDYNNDHPIAGVPPRQTDYSEIDIAENDPMSNLMTSNCWYRKDPTTNPKHFDYWERHADCDETSHADAYIEQTGWHTYSLEWTPTEMNTYYDNKLVRHMEYPANLFDAMNVILDIEGAYDINNDKSRFCRVISQGVTNLPFNFEIDFVKIYKLNTEDCNVSLNYPNYNFTGYTYNLKKDITLGKNGVSTASVTVVSGQKISIRAVDFIELEDGFYVDDNAGTEFFATTNGTCDY